MRTGLKFTTYTCVFIVTLLASISVSAEPPRTRVPADWTYFASLSSDSNTIPEDLVSPLEDLEDSESTPDDPYPKERGVYGVKEGMTKNTRHTKEGFWIGALPEVSNIVPMRQHWIRVILTVTYTKTSWESVKHAIAEQGIEHILLPIGSRFPQDTSFYDSLLPHSPDEIFIHCDHGGDRSGTFMAYMLMRRAGWTPQRALLAMLNPSKTNLAGLKEVLKKHGISVTYEDMKYLWIYSGVRNHGFGGMKAHNEGYHRLISTMLDAYEKYDP